MLKTKLIQALLQELDGETINPTVEVVNGSHAVLYPDSQHYDDDDGIVFDAEECKKLFSSKDTALRLIDTLSLKFDASLILHYVTIDGDVLDVLECNLAAVEEG